jgi:hypothetical protein
MARPARIDDCPNSPPMFRPRGLRPVRAVVPGTGIALATPIFQRRLLCAWCEDRSSASATGVMMCSSVKCAPILVHRDFTHVGAANAPDVRQWSAGDWCSASANHHAHSTLHHAVLQATRRWCGFWSSAVHGSMSGAQALCWAPYGSKAQARMAGVRGRSAP